MTKMFGRSCADAGVEASNEPTSKIRNRRKKRLSLDVSAMNRYRVAELPSFENKRQFRTNGDDINATREQKDRSGVSILLAISQAGSVRHQSGYPKIKVELSTRTRVAVSLAQAIGRASSAFLDFCRVRRRSG